MFACDHGVSLALRLRRSGGLQHIYSDLRPLDVTEAPEVSHFRPTQGYSSSMAFAPPFPSVVLHLASNVLALVGSCDGFFASCYQAWTPY